MASNISGIKGDGNVNFKFKNGNDFIFDIIRPQETLQLSMILKEDVIAEISDRSNIVSKNKHLVLFFDSENLPKKIKCSFFAVKRPVVKKRKYSEMDSISTFPNPSIDDDFCYLSDISNEGTVYYKQVNVEKDKNLGNFNFIFN